MGNRFTAPIKYQPGITVDLPVVVLSSTISHKMGIYGAKFEYKTKTGSLFDHQYKTVREAFPRAEIVLGTGKNSYKANKNLKNTWGKDGVKMVENSGWAETSEIEILRLALNVLPDASRILIISGDVFFDVKALNFLSSTESITTYYKDKHADEIGLNFNEHKNDKLMGISCEFEHKWSNLLYLTGKELDLLRQFCSPKNCKMEYWELLQYILNNSGQILCKPTPGKIIRAYSSEKIGEMSCVG
jgi:CTP:phosphocholine cytidylyltransferase-like protein